MNANLARRCGAVGTLAAAMLAGCANKEFVNGGLGGWAPNPNGCYVFVYDQVDWHGERVVLNGPGRWGTVGRLRRDDDKDWQDNIHSIEVGSSATVTLYAEANFRGVFQRLGPASVQGRFVGSLNAAIKSISLSCRPDTP